MAHERNARVPQWLARPVHERPQLLAPLRNTPSDIRCRWSWIEISGLNRFSGKGRNGFHMSGGGAKDALTPRSECGRAWWGCGVAATAPQRPLRTAARVPPSSRPLAGHLLCDPLIEPKRRRALLPLRLQLALLNRRVELLLALAPGRSTRHAMSGGNTSLK